MISSEVQRTLVKSPPELWAEISDPESLARHLGEFGEIRITRLQPEQKVEWEAANASGTVAIKPSGWGTKVKLTVTRELVEAERDVEDAVGPEEEQASEPALAALAESQDEAELEDEAELDAEPEPAHEVELDAEPELAHEAELDYEPQFAYEQYDDVTSEPERTLEPVSEPEPQARRGFFARLFGRRRSRDAAVAPPMLTELEPLDVEQEPQADGVDRPEQTQVDELAPASESMPVAEQQLETTAPDAIEAQPRERDDDETPALSAELLDAPDDSPVENEAVAAPDPAAELALAEETAAAEVTAVLTGVLDRLGAAHHRPFSRA